MRTLGIIVVVIAVIGGGWFGYERFVESEPSSGFITSPLVRGDIVQAVSATGTIEPLVKVIVGSEVSGIIKKWNADFNQVVKQGDVLAYIDPVRFRTAHDRAKADLLLAQAREEELHVRYKDAERERKRLELLHEQNNASENELQQMIAEEDAARAAWHGAQASVLSSKAALSERKVDLDKSVIRSPINGVVIARNIEDGQTVAASLQAPELFVIANDLKRMQVNANVSESDIGLIREGKSASFTVDAFPRRTFEGTITQIRFNATDVDGVVTYVTLIEVENDELLLRPGMSANVTFEVAKAESVIQIPNAALRFDPTPPSEREGRRKYAATSKKPVIYVLLDGRPDKREVGIGLSNGMVTELKSGDIKEKDLVIVERDYLGNRNRRTDPSRSLRTR